MRETTKGEGGAGAAVRGGGETAGLAAAGGAAGAGGAAAAAVPGRAGTPGRGAWGPAAADPGAAPAAGQCSSSPIPHQTGPHLFGVHPSGSIELKVELILTIASHSGFHRRMDALGSP